jgi:ATP-dependent DNA helicase DinG
MAVITPENENELLAGDRVLGPDGVIARSLSGYEARRPQVEMANLVDELIRDQRHGLIEAGTGCIQGDAEIVINRAGNGTRINLRDLVYKFNSGVIRRKLTGHGSSGWKEYRWDLSIPTYVQREENGVFRLARLKAAWCSGRKITYTVTTHTGRQIRATTEHPFLTERGWLKLGDLRIGDEVHVVGCQCTTGRRVKPRYRSIYRMHAHPFACHRKNGSASVDHHRLVAEATANGMDYESFVSVVRAGQVTDLNFINPKTHEVHHRDRNSQNDDPNNLEVLCHAEHARRHAEEGTSANVLYKVALERIVSVELYGEEITYDLEVEDDPHNFTANGFVVHNTGKSLGYLIPAILSGKRVVISTDTIQLQEQLVGKDLPFLQKVLQPLLGRPFRFAIAKGRSHFLCPRNCHGLIEERGMIAEYNLASYDAEAALEEYTNPLKGWDGDRAHLQLPIADDRWAKLCGDESCTGSSCEYATNCPSIRAKTAYEQAEVVVTNHTMYLLHHWVLERTFGAVGILPQHTVWIADEAHTLSDKCCDQFGVEISDRQPAAYVRRIKRQAKRLHLTLSDNDLNLEAVQRAADGFFEVFHGAVKQEQLLAEFPPEILDLARQMALELIAKIKPIRVALHWAAMDIPPDDYERRSAIERLYTGADLLIEGLDTILAPEPDGTDEAELRQWRDQVRYAEVTGSDLARKEITLHCKPIETRPIFRRILNNLESAIFCSATLATGYGAGAFRTIADELGLMLSDCATLQVESPFDYANAVRGYVPKGMPELRSPEYHTAVAEEVIQILNHSQGRAFILFTSVRDMKRVYELVIRRVRFPVLIQGQASKDALIEEFKETPNCVLFGVKTFWTGVDVAGDALSCVVIVKLPFPSPESPLNKARCARIDAREHGNSFRDFMLPRCIRDVKQGFGRLIRTSRDRGLFVILDPRMRTARYGRDIADSLPPFPCTGTLE